MRGEKLKEMTVKRFGEFDALTEGPDREELPDTLDPWSVFRRRKGLILIGLVVALGLGAAYYTFRKPEYESQAQLLVATKRPRALPVPGADPRLAYLENYLFSHQKLIESPMIVEQAVRRHGLDGLKSLSEAPDAVGAILEQMSVHAAAEDERHDGHALIQLSYRGATPEETRLVLQAVIDSYQQFLKETEQSDGNDIRQLFVQWRDEIQKELTEKQDAYRELRKNAPSWLWAGGEGVQLAQQRLAGIAAERLGHQVRQAEIREQLAALEGAKAQGVSGQVLAEMASRWNAQQKQQRPDGSLVNQWTALLNEERGLLQHYGPRHPDVLAVRERIELTRGLLAGPRGDEPGQNPLDPAEAYRQFLEHELRIVDKLEQSLAARIDEETAKATMATSVSEDIQELAGEIASLRELRGQIVKHLQEVGLHAQSEVYQARIVSPPLPGIQIAPSAATTFPVAAFLGMLFGTGLAYLLEVTDRGFRNPEEIRRRLSVPVVGHIPWDRPNRKSLRLARANGPTLDPVLCTHFRPQSLEAEAYRGVRTTLYFRGRIHEHKVLQITSPSAGDGKSTVAANLAVSMAQAGKRVVLVDADFRQPSVDRLFGVSARIGLADVLAGEAELWDAVVPSGELGLRLLPCGPIPSNPAELLMAHRFQGVLEQLRQDCDVVLVDTPPVLAVSDACAVAPRSDGVLLTIRVSRHGRLETRRAMEMLHAVDAQVLGVVVNGVERSGRSGGYNYPCYGRNYGGSNAPTRSRAGLERQSPAVREIKPR